MWGTIGGCIEPATKEGSQENHVQRHFLQKDLSDTWTLPERSKAEWADWKTHGPSPPAEFGRPAVRPSQRECCCVRPA